MAAAAVFDIGNVLIRWDPAQLYNRLIGDEAERRRFLAEICPQHWNETFDRGAPMEQGVAAHAARHPAHADLIHAWWQRWPEMLGPAIEGSVACLRALRARGAKVYALSNFAADTFEIARTLYPFLDDFDGRVISAHVGSIKPEPEIYARLEAMAGLPPEALFFTDDSPANVAAARARGWRAHLFTGPRGLIRALIDNDLLAPHEAPRLED